MKKQKISYKGGSRVKTFVIWTLLSFLAISANSQFYQYGEEPGTVKWEKIESNNFKLIYPDILQRDAQKLLIILEKNRVPNSEQLDGQPKKTNVILHTHTVRSNGFVIWAPRRMEFFMFPDIESDAQDWYTHLSLHEYRHIVQTGKMNAGFSKLLTTVLGEQGLGPAAGMTPFWLLEGDAVYAETSLTKAGRGRNPAFEMGIKAHLLKDEKAYSFSKSYLGSYKDYVPSYYEYGYQMVSYGLEKYGMDIWADAFSHIGKKPYQINPLYFYLRGKNAGSKKDLYFETTEYLRLHWEKTSKDRLIDEYDELNKVKHKVFTSYRSPQLTANNTIIAVKSNSRITDRFVEIFEDGSEKTVFIPGFLYTDRISYSKGRILWDEYIPGSRFRNQSYSVLKEYNLSTKKLRYISMNSRYTSPAYSDGGDTIIAVETSLSNDFNLVFISALDAGVFTKVPSPENMQILDPVWLKDSDQVVVVGLSEKGKSLQLYDRSQDSWEEIHSSGNVNISRPAYSGGHIYFHGSYDGLDNIFALRLKDRKLFKVSHAEFGAFEPDISEKSGDLVFSNYSVDGYNLSKVNTGSLKLEDVDLEAPVKEQAFFSYSDTVKTIISDYSLKNISQPEKYSRLGNLFNLHSWAPFYFDYSNPDIDNPQASPGITLLSQNLLSTAVSYLAWEYKDQQNFFHSGFRYTGWLPVIDVSWSYGGDSRIIPVSDSTISTPSTSTASEYSISTYIPYSLSMGKWSFGMQPSLQLSYASDYFYFESDREYRRGISYLDAGFYMYLYQKTAELDLIPRWGFIMNLASLSAPFEDEQRGSVTSFGTTLYFPGIIRNQGIRIRNQWQGQNTQKYLFGNAISYPRGETAFTTESIYKLTADYYLPLLYPDLNIEGLFYLKRIRAQVFYDYLYGNNVYFRDASGLSLVNGSFSSTGIELRADYHVFRILFPLASGIRISYNNRTGNIIPEFIFNIDINRF